MTASDVAVIPALRRAALRAAHAYSVHNTQPWHFDLRQDRLDIVADQSRRMEALDASGRQIGLSLGAAVLAARASLAAAGLDAAVARFPSATDPNLIAQITVAGPRDEEVLHPLAGLDTYVEQLQAGPMEFTAGDVPPDLLLALDRAATLGGVSLHVVPDRDGGEQVAALCRHARAIQVVDPACRAELKAWAGSLDAGVPAVTAGGHPTVVVIGTERDDRLSWLRTGEVLEHLLLEVTRGGFAARPTTCVSEVPSTREALRTSLGLGWLPHVVLQVGRAPRTTEPRRRRLVDVLFEPL